MRIKRLLALSAVCFIGVAGCYWWVRGTDPDISLLNDGPIDVHLYRNHRRAGGGTLMPESAAANAIRALFERKRGRWWLSYFHNSHDELSFGGKGFTLDIQRRVIVINYRERWKGNISLVTNVTTNEYEALKKLVLESLSEGRKPGRD
jgi:hypothetical protein